MIRRIWQSSRSSRWLFALLAILVIVGLNGAKPKKKAKSAKKKPAVSAVSQKDPPRVFKKSVPDGRPWYEQMVSDGVFRIAVFWGWDSPREVVEGVFPAFETLNGKSVYYQGRKARIEIGLVTQVSENPREMFQAALEDPSVDVVIYSGHARYGAGPAFGDRDDIFRCGDGQMVEDRHTKPFRRFKATSEDLDQTTFPQTYRIIMLNCCDSSGHFRKTWNRRLRECGAATDLITVEFPVFNMYDHVRLLNLIRDLLQFADWKTIKAHYDAEIHKRENFLVVEPVFIPSVPVAETEEDFESAPEDDHISQIPAVETLPATAVAAPTPRPDSHLLTQVVTPEP
ncbi:MAG TPA: hypothetical protein PKO06_11935 [Candidatus Ozemobacteraceae bacterium]|nr:hypothetical protein [Candidatus Ozemobacteraceae bacterium]